MIKLRIVERNKLYIVQMGVPRTFSKKLLWVDASVYYLKGAFRVMLPIPITVFDKLEDAEKFCEDFLRKQKPTHSFIVKTYE